MILALIYLRVFSIIFVVFTLWNYLEARRYGSIQITSDYFSTVDMLTWSLFITSIIAWFK